MNLKKFVSCAFAASIFVVKAQPGTINMTPIQQMPLQPVVIEVPPQYAGQFPANRVIQLPVGYKASVYHVGGLTKPRFMSFDEKGVLHVADQTAGRVYAMPDMNKDGIADTIWIAADGFSVSHDVKFYKGAMYVTNERRIWKLTDTNTDGVYETRSVFIDSIAEGATQPGGGHRTRTLVFDSVHHKAYVSIGSLCNACRESFRAVIEEYNDDGTGKRIYATGVRNAVGMAIQPGTGKLWANNNGSDRQGNEIPPEWVDIVREGGYYGYPFAYANQVWFNFNAHPDYQALLPITSSDSQQVSQMIEPAALIRAHTAPMAMTFLSNAFPSDMQYGMLMALRGSWNAPQSHRGYSLIYLHLSGAQDTSVDYVSDFATGFITDTTSRTFWARPVGLATTDDGEIFMSSDEGTSFILRIYPEKTTGIRDMYESDKLMLWPNPASGIIHIQYSGHRVQHIQICNMSGIRLCQSSSEQVDISQLPPSMYVVKATLENGAMLYTKIIKTDNIE